MISFKSRLKKKSAELMDFNFKLLNSTDRASFVIFQIRLVCFELNYKTWPIEIKQCQRKLMRSLKLNNFLRLVLITT